MWLVRALILVSLVFSFGLLLTAIHRRRARPTVRNWRGNARSPDLSPAETAMLAGQHPATVLVLLLLDLSRRGRLRWSVTEPESASLPGPPAGPVEAAIVEALAGAGRLALDGALRVLDALHAKLEAKMAGCSGAATVRHARALAEEARSSLDPEEPPPEGIEALLLWFDANEVWNSVGRGPEWEGVRAAFRAREALRRSVFPAEALSERARAARGGFLAFRPDLAR